MTKRNTIQRQLIVNAIGHLKKHPTVDEVYSYIAVNYPGISKGTIYRNINMLVEEGELMRLTSPAGADRFDSGVKRHYHIYCRECGELIDAPLPYDAQLDEAINKLGDFDVDSHDIIFYGVCPTCKIEKEKGEQTKN